MSKFDFHSEDKVFCRLTVSALLPIAGVILCIIRPGSGFMLMSVTASAPIKVEVYVVLNPLGSEATSVTFSELKISQPPFRIVRVFTLECCFLEHTHVLSHPDFHGASISLFHGDRHLFLRVFPIPLQNKQEQPRTPPRQKQDNKTPRENQDEQKANKRNKKKTEKKKT